VVIKKAMKIIKILKGFAIIILSCILLIIVILSIRSIMMPVCDGTPIIDDTNYLNFRDSVWQADHGVPYPYKDSVEYKEYYPHYPARTRTPK
jgi:hypothetical protein